LMANGACTMCARIKVGESCTSSMDPFADIPALMACRCGTTYSCGTNNHAAIWDITFHATGSLTSNCWYQAKYYWASWPQGMPDCTDMSMPPQYKNGYQWPT